MITPQTSDQMIATLRASLGEAPAPEPDFDVPLPSVLDDVPTGARIIFERKSSSEDLSPGATFWARKTLDVQPTMYLAAEPSATVVIYDVLRKPEKEPHFATPIEKREYRKDGKLYAKHREHDESPHDYFLRLCADIEERPEWYYQRGIVVRLEDEAKRAAVNLWQTAEEIVIARRRGAWPMSPSSCFDFNRRCEFFGVCAGTDSINNEARFETREQKTHLPVLSASAVNTWSTCHRKYYYAYELRRRPRAKDAALTFGTRIHEALEAWSKSGLDAAVAAATRDVYDYDAAKAHAMLLGYHARWSGARVKFVALEREFQTELVDPHTGAVSREFLIGGAIDAVAEKI